MSKKRSQHSSFSGLHSSECPAGGDFCGCGCIFAFLKSWEKTDFSNATTAVSQSNYFHSNPRALPLTNQIASCKHPERVRWTLVWFSKCRRSWSLQQVILWKVDISTVRFPTGLWVIVFCESQNHQTSGNGLHVFFNMTRNEWLSPKLIRKLFTEVRAEGHFTTDVCRTTVFAATLFKSNKTCREQEHHADLDKKMSLHFPDCTSNVW